MSSETLRKVVMSKKVALVHLKRIAQHASTFTVYFSDDVVGEAFVAKSKHKYGSAVSCYVGYDNAIFITMDLKVASAIQKRASELGLDFSE